LKIKYLNKKCKTYIGLFIIILKNEDYYVVKLSQKNKLFKIEQQ